VASVITCTGMRLNDDKLRSRLAILRTDLALMPTSAATCRVLLLVPGLPSCEHISSCTLAMLSADLADFGLPLPAFLSTADPVLSICRQIVWSVLRLQFFIG